MSEHQRYPMMMSHPHYRKAKMEKVSPELPDRKSDWRQVATEQFPPVMVHTEDQEEQHKAKGYVPNGTSDPAAYADAVADAPAPDYEADEYPKWVHGVLCEDVDAELKAMEEHEERLRNPPKIEDEQTVQAPSAASMPALQEMIAQAVAQAVAAALGDGEMRRGPGRPRKEA